MARQKTEYYFKHDQGANNDPKIVSMMNSWGVQGYGMFWIIIETLRSSSLYKIENKEYSYDFLSSKMRVPVEDVKRFINDCIEKFDLLQSEEGFFYSSSLLRRMADLDLIREKRSIAGERGAEARWKDKPEESKW